MGEYAKRKSDGQEIKIGTCESMYYLRYDDRNMVYPLPGSLNPAKEKGLFFRLPFPDEDKFQPGDYQDHNRGLRLYDKNGDFADDTTADSPGTIQLKHECGLLVNVPCYHGVKLPEASADIKTFWNGKSWFLELSSVKLHTDGKLWPVVRCRHCGKLWRYEWTDVMPFVSDAEMKKRLEAYINE